DNLPGYLLGLGITAGILILIRETHRQVCRDLFQMSHQVFQVKEAGGAVEEDLLPSLLGGQDLFLGDRHTQIGTVQPAILVKDQYAALGIDNSPERKLKAGSLFLEGKQGNGYRVHRKAQVVNVA